ncbi:COP9 signalosome complex subunit 8 [Apophysomyces sp. BC1015]|nr:COP9 signalosome complex subunit 8 [Apophysomyces sp. BC1015]
MSIGSHILTGDYRQLVKTCEQLELQHAATPSSVNMAEVYAPYLAGYILLDDLNSARFLRKRILSSGQPSAEVDAVWAICVALWERRYSDIYAKLQMQWSTLMQPLAIAIQEPTARKPSDLAQFTRLADAVINLERF